MADRFEIVHAERVREAIAEGVTVLDVREPNEHEAGHLEGPIRVPLGFTDIVDRYHFRSQGEAASECWRNRGRDQTASGPFLLIASSANHVIPSKPLHPLLFPVRRRYERPHAP